MRKRKIGILAIIVLLCATVGLGAQTSNTAVGTGYVFLNNTDYFMSVVDYTAITNSYLFLGLTTSNLEAGYGQVVSPGFYLAGYYNGYIVGQDNSSDPDTTSITTDYILNNNVIVGETKTTSVSGTTINNSNNDFYVLAGISGWGIKLGVIQDATVTTDRWGINNITLNTTTTTWTALDSTPASGQADQTSVTYADDLTTLVANSVTTYTGGTQTDSQLEPVLDVGTKLDLGGLILKPELTAKFDFHQTGLSQSYVSYVQNIGSGFPMYPETTGIDEAKSYNTVDYAQAASYTGLDIAVSAALVLNDVHTFQLGYAINAPLYSNAYVDNAGADQTVAGKAYSYHSTSYTYTIADITTTDLRAFQTETDSAATHTISPAYKLTVPFGEKLSMGFTAGADLEIYNSTTSTAGGLTKVTTTTSNVDSLNDSTSTFTKTYSGESVAVSKFTCTPAVTAGLQFKIIPDVLVFSLGGYLSLPEFVNQSTTTTIPGITTCTTVTTSGTGVTTTDTYSSTLADSRTETQTSYADINQVSTAVTGGLALTMAEGVTLDMQLMNLMSAQSLITAFTVQLSISK